MCYELVRLHGFELSLLTIVGSWHDAEEPMPLAGADIAEDYLAAAGTDGRLLFRTGNWRAVTPLRL